MRADWLPCPEIEFLEFFFQEIKEMSNSPKNVVWGEDVIGNVSHYPAIPTVLCSRCGSKLYRVYNTQTEWNYLCLEEKILIDPENREQTLEVDVN